MRNAADIVQPSNIIEISLKPGVQPQIDAALALRSVRLFGGGAARAGQSERI